MGEYGWYAKWHVNPANKKSPVESGDSFVEGPSNLTADEASNKIRLELDTEFGVMGYDLFIEKPVYMRKVKMEARNIIQGSDEWLALRQSKITATDVAAILGISPYKSSYDLWNEKHGRGKPFITNPAVERGSRIEPDLRRWYEGLKGESYEPKVMIHPYESWAMASLDGISKCGKHLLEIKTVGKEAFLKAQNGQLPDFFISQGQHQMMCSIESEDNTFLCEWKDEKCLVTIPRDDLYIKKVSAICKDWYDRYMIGDEEPALSERDYLDLSDNFQFACVAAEARVIYKEYKQLEKEWKAVKERLLDCSDGGSCRGCGISIRQSTRKGSIDTDKLVADLDIDLEKYRKPSTSSLTVTVNLKYKEGEQ